MRERGGAGPIAPSPTALSLPVLLAALVLLFPGCGDDPGFRPEPGTGAIALTPDSASVKPGEQIAFTAEVTGLTDETVAWSVNAVAGGNAELGTIASDGLYSAPQTLPSEATVTVTATSVEDTTVRGHAAVTIMGVVLTPSSTVAGPGEQIGFDAEVTGVENQSVSWSVNGTQGGSVELGTVDESGLYTAPAVAPDPRTVAVTAQSEADPDLEGTASVTVLTVDVAPAELTIGAGQSGTFSAEVYGQEGAPLTWYVNDEPGGNSAVGTISSDGTYTAPVLISGQFSATVKAACTEHPSAFADATVTVVEPVQVEMEDYVSAIDVGGDPIYQVNCGYSSGGLAVEGFDRVGEALAFRVSFDLGGYYGGVLKASTFKDSVHDITVTIEGAGPGGEDQVVLFELKGKGLG